MLSPRPVFTPAHHCHGDYGDPSPSEDSLILAAAPAIVGVCSQASGKAGNLQAPPSQSVHEGPDSRSSTRMGQVSGAPGTFPPDVPARPVSRGGPCLIEQDFAVSGALLECWGSGSSLCTYQGKPCLPPPPPRL